MDPVGQNVTHSLTEFSTPADPSRHARGDDRACERLAEQATAIRRGVATITGRLRYESAGELSGNQVAVLGMLFRFGDLTAGAVASRMGRSPQSLTRVLAALEDDGLLGRRTDPTDGRRVLLALTLEGREALGREMAPRDRWLAAALERLCTPTERELLMLAAALLDRVADLPGTAPIEPDPTVEPARAVELDHAVRA